MNVDAETLEAVTSLRRRAATLQHSEGPDVADRLARSVVRPLDRLLGGTVALPAEMSP